MQQRIQACLLALAAVAASAAVPASAQSLTGTWQMTSETPRGNMTQTLTLTQDGSDLTGTISFGGGPRGGGRGRGGGMGQPIDITDGTVDGNAFSFTMTIEFGGRGPFTQQFSGTFEGDSMEGTVEGGRGGSRPFTATRVE